MKGDGKLYNSYDLREKLKPEEILMYLRKSRADDPLLSVSEVLSKHEAILDEWCERNLSALIPEENRFREIVSGGDSIEERPAFQKVLKMVESSNFRAVICVEISRLGRPDTMEIGRISKTFMCTNTIVITPSRMFNVADKYERDMFEQELRMGQYFLDYIKTILRTGRDESAKRGCYLGSKPVYGYDKVTITEGKRKFPTLAINEEQANIVRWIFTTYINENIGTQIIANRLNDMKVKAPRADMWTSDTIRGLLANQHFLGMVRWNTRKTVMVVENGEFRKTRPLNTGDDIIFTKGLHEAIISQEMFDAAREKRGRAHKTPTNRAMRNPLASILFCECGRGMSYRDTERGDKNRPGNPNLVCNRQSVCHNASCSIDEIMSIVVEALRKRIHDFDIELTDDNHASNKYNKKLLKNLEKKLADLDTKELSLWESQVDPDISNRMPQHIFQSLIDKLVKEREETKIAIEKTRESILTPVNIEKKRATLQQALDAILDDTVSVPEKNGLLKSCIERITYSREPSVKRLGKGSGKGYIKQPISVDIKLKV
jgi:DNA invertase Pin-like site-specific DNA recombinase